jgi:hypothetical protein
VQAGNSVFGIAAPTGKPRWRCDGPGPVTGLVSTGEGNRPETIAFQSNTATVIREALPTDGRGRVLLPAAAAVPGLGEMPDPWLARPLPWARKEPLPWNCFALVFVAFVLFLWWKRFRKTAAVLVGSVLLVSGGFSIYLLIMDAAYKDLAQYYALTDWYGMASVVAAVLGGLIAFYLAVAAILFVPVLAVRKTWRRFRMVRP